MGTRGHQLQCRCSCQKMCWKEFPKNVPLLSQLCSMPIKVANRSIVQHMGTKGDRQQCRCLCQKFGVEGISKMSMTLPMTFQANKSCKRKHSTAYWNYSYRFRRPFGDFSGPKTHPIGVFSGPKKPKTRIERIRGLNLSRSENFRALKPTRLEYFRARLS